MSIARGFIPCSSTLFSLLAHTLLLLLLLLLRLLLFVGLRLAADHSYQHNYKLGCRLCVSLTSPHPSRRNTRSLSRPGEIFVFVFFSFLHLFYLLLFFFLFFSSSSPLLSSRCLLLLCVSSDRGFLLLSLCVTNAANFFRNLSSTYRKFSIEKLRKFFICNFSTIYSLIKKELLKISHSSVFYILFRFEIRCKRCCVMSQSRTTV